MTCELRLTRVIGLPVILGQRLAGHVERARLTPDGRQLAGLVIRRGLGGARWVSRETICVLGDVSVVLRGAPTRLSGESAAPPHRVTDESGLTLGMYRVLDDFFEGVVTDAALISCLSVLKLGKQYVFLNEAACRQVKIEKEIELSFFEKEIIQKASADYRQKGLKLTDEMYKKNRRAGNYFDEILGEAN